LEHPKIQVTEYIQIALEKAEALENDSAKRLKGIQKALNIEIKK